MNSNMVKGIIAMHRQRGYLTTNEIRMLRGAVHKSELPLGLAKRARLLLTDEDPPVLRKFKYPVEVVDG